MPRCHCCVIIPTYNNEKTILQVIKEVSLLCPHLIVVNDGSTDSTPDLLKSLDSDIDVVSLQKNRGKGRALVEGFRRAMALGYTHAITIDADGQHYPHDIPRFLEAIEKYPNRFLVGARNLNEENMPRQNTFANRFSNFWFRLQTGVNLPDTQCGFRCYPLAALHGLSLITARYEAELELLVFAAWNGEEIDSIPVSVYYPPAEERVSHFRPFRDFLRISILNTILCLIALCIAFRQAAYTVFAFCYFLGLALEMTLAGFFLITVKGKNDENKRRYHRLLQRRARFVTHHIPGTSFTFSNPEGETFEKPALIIANHQSHLDLMAIMMLTPNLIILTKNWVWHNPFYGIVIRYADYFPISETEQMVENLAQMVEKGYSVMIFPEGTRSVDCHIQRFHRGAFYLAERLALDVVPVVIDGFGKVLPKKSFYLHPGHLTMKVLPRLLRENITEDYRIVTKQLHQEFEKVYHHR